MQLLQSEILIAKVRIIRKSENGREETRNKDRTEYPISNTEYPMSKVDSRKTGVRQTT